MATAKKVETVAQIADWLRRAQVTVLTEYRGLTVADLTRLRRQLRDAGVEYHIVKNTLARRAASELGLDGELAEVLTGPTAIAIGLNDQVSAARALSEYMRTSRGPMRIKGALLDGRFLDAKAVEELANLPTLEVLRAQAAGAIQGPLASVVGTLESALRTLLYTFEQRAEQLGGAPSGAS
jgi:large subunit ribosomal protein L10